MANFHLRHEHFERRLLVNELIETKMECHLALHVQAIKPYAGAPERQTIQTSDPRVRAPASKATEASGCLRGLFETPPECEVCAENVTRRQRWGRPIHALSR